PHVTFDIGSIFMSPTYTRPSLVDFFSFYFAAPATTEIYTLSLHDALPISASGAPRPSDPGSAPALERSGGRRSPYRSRSRRYGLDRKSTRLNSSHVKISYAVFCLKKKK